MEEPTDKVRPLLARLGGAKTLLRLAASDNAGGFGMSEVTGAGAGVSMEQLKSVSRDVLGFTREQVGAETADKAVVAIPGLSQFM